MTLLQAKKGFECQSVESQAVMAEKAICSEGEPCSDGDPPQLIQLLGESFSG